MSSTTTVTVFRGNRNKLVRIVYRFKYETSGQFKTVTQRKGSNGDTFYNIIPSYSVQIFDSEKNNIYVPSSTYFQLVALIEKGCNLITSHLSELYPNINKIEFEIDHRTLERFQTEEALLSGDITVMPDTYVDSTNSTYPSMRISNKAGAVNIPLEDIKAMVYALRGFDPIGCGLTLLNILTN